MFEEKLAPGGADIKVWRTEQATEGHVKVLETLSEDETRKLPAGKAFKTEVLFVDKAYTAKNKRDDESNVSWMAKSYQKHVGTESQTETRETSNVTHKQEPKQAAAAADPQMEGRDASTVGKKQVAKHVGADSKIEERDITSVVQKQVQKERQGEMEITRNITQKDTLEHEHRAVVKEVRVAGPGNAEAIAPLFSQKINPVVVRAGQDAVFQCVFSGKPAPRVTWMRENTIIQQSTKYQVCFPTFGSALICSHA